MTWVSRKERLTTTKVAARAGVSVGTLYQYFPNKSSLPQSVLRLHLEEVIKDRVENVNTAGGREMRLVMTDPEAAPSCS